MSKVYLLQNQTNKLLLGKSGAWLDGRNPAALFRTEHKDEAINQQFEVGSKDYSLRIKLLLCETNSKRQPIISADDMPEPLPELDIAESAADSEANAQAEVEHSTQDSLL